MKVFPPIALRKFSILNLLLSSFRVFFVVIALIDEISVRVVKNSIKKELQTIFAVDQVACRSRMMDERRRQSRRLLQDVKTKSIERLLLPLIKQVSFPFDSFIHRNSSQIYYCEWTAVASILS